MLFMKSGRKCGGNPQPNSLQNPDICYSFHLCNSRRVIFQSLCCGTVLKHEYQIKVTIPRVHVLYEDNPGSVSDTTYDPPKHHQE